MSTQSILNSVMLSKKWEGPKNTHSKVPFVYISKGRTRKYIVYKYTCGKALIKIKEIIK